MSDVSLFFLQTLILGTTFPWNLKDEEEKTKIFSQIKLGESWFTDIDGILPKNGSVRSTHGLG